MSEQTKSILRIENCEKHFPITGGLLSKTVGHVKAVDGVDLEVSKGETYSIVGESGCGKSTLARCILKLIEPTNGKIIFKGKDLTELEESEMMQIRKNIQIVFQDPYWSLNPRMMVKDIVGEPIKEHKDYSKQKRIERVKELNCFYGITKIIKDKDLCAEEALQQIVEILPPSWQHEDAAEARIIVNEQEFKTDNFEETNWCQSSNIKVEGQKVGELQIC